MATLPVHCAGLEAYATDLHPVAQRWRRHQPPGCAMAMMTITIIKTVGTSLAYR